MDFYTVGLVFLAMVVYQTVAKKLRLPLLSSGLDYAKDRAITFFDWLGELTGRWLNIYEWIKSLERLIVDHLWDNIKPFFESVAEIISPAWKLLFSWGYFFVGFARTHYIFFSWLGGSIVLGTVGYFTRPYWWHLVIWLDHRAVGTFLLALVIGMLMAFPDILPKMFPRVRAAVVNVGDTVNNAFDTDHVIVNGVRHEVRDLERWTLAQLSELIDDLGSDTVGCRRTKVAYINRIRRLAR